MDEQQRRIIGQEAKQLLENRHFKEAFEAVKGYIDDQADSCDPDNKDKAARIILSKQLLSAIKREIVRKIEDGEMAQIQINELERQKGLFRFMR